MAVYYGTFVSLNKTNVSSELMLIFFCRMCGNVGFQERNKRFACERFVSVSETHSSCERLFCHGKLRGSSENKRFIAEFSLFVFWEALKGNSRVEG